MQIKGNNIQQARLTIRVSRNTLSFSVVDREVEHQLIYEPYTVKSGVSMAANLRQAFKESTLLQRGYQKVRVYLDSPILLVPIEEFHEEDIDVLYQHAFNSHNSDAILYRVQPELNAVAVFPINKDLKMVIEDNFKDVRFTPIMQPFILLSICKLKFHHNRFSSFIRQDITFMAHICQSSPICRTSR